MHVRLACMLLACLAPIAATAARETLPGPVAARLIAVVDGDTIRVRARIWLGQDIETSVRLVGVNAPERRGGCIAERRLAERAVRFIEAALIAGDLQLRDIRRDKYGGRVAARVSTTAGGDLGAALLAAGLARAYDGGRRTAWCG